MHSEKKKINIFMPSFFIELISDSVGSDSY